ncbi:MAG: DUF2080 family transposase-associated protein [Nanoarchaeota archaeon]
MRSSNEEIRNAIRWGNSAGVLLPKDWAGQQVKVILIDRTLEIKKEVFNILQPYLENVLGIYLVGSYARNEQEEDSDIDIIVISDNLKKDIISGRYNISITPLEKLRKTIQRNPILVLPRLNEAKVIINSPLLKELKSTKITDKSFKNFIEETKRIINISKGFIQIDKGQEREYLDSISIIYSLILRLRGVYLIKRLLEKKNYSKKEFSIWIKKELNKEEFEKVYAVYKAIKNGKKINDKIKIETAEKLIKMLKKEVDKINVK